ncbi:MAG: hemerythrin domain-containing protein [Bryobacteraceae bacterium]
MHPIEILSQEHRVIEARLDELELEIQALEAGQPLRRDWFEETLDFFRDFADRRHHAKEENLLFPRMKQRGVPEQGGPIGVMLAEHDEGRGYLKAIRRNLADAAVMADARGEAIADARSYIALLRQHIYKEDHILFRIARLVLTAEDVEDLNREFAACAPPVNVPPATAADPKLPARDALPCGS